MTLNKIMSRLDAIEDLVRRHHRLSDKFLTATYAQVEAIHDHLGVPLDAGDDDDRS